MDHPYTTGFSFSFAPPRFYLSFTLAHFPKCIHRNRDNCTQDLVGDKRILCTTTYACTKALLNPTKHSLQWHRQLQGTLQAFWLLFCYPFPSIPVAAGEKFLYKTLLLTVAYSHEASSHSHRPLWLHQQQRAGPSSRQNDSNNFFPGSRDSCVARNLLVLPLHLSSPGSSFRVHCALLLVLQWPPWLPRAAVFSCHWRQRLTIKFLQNRTSHCEMKLL